MTALTPSSAVPFAAGALLLELPAGAVELPAALEFVDLLPLDEQALTSSEDAAARVIRPSALLRMRVPPFPGQKGDSVSPR